ncbi:MULTISPECIES: Crp/Fnr family transcriptional regulator [unclassified Streptomyces]|uniref:Crp/Fnr family transcriptional regulator n=1 Tax=unclassified Streptomyces TaxID=2593676 RepID=UPI001BEBA903|nr:MULTISPECIES: cyclic nucleotide-binding domain-containing protein [unclassified Streptomyces]MBT2402180.1 Crp/Fnr family transcriptional regulator [Streptomyces sp. ISL-21]MBT2609366.1 Crp/Fnr family transcriptional regulator [Streptomyces sp. ISL-87]
MWLYDTRWRGLLELAPKQEKAFCSGDVLVPGDEELGYVLALTEGLVNATVTTADGRELQLAWRKPPCVLGDLSALRGGRTSAWVTAVTDATAVRITAPAFTDYLNGLGLPGQLLAQVLDWTYREDLKRAQERVLPLRSQLAAFLLTVAGEVTSGRLEGWDQDHLAALFHVSGRTLRDKALQPLEQAGAVVRSRCRVTIADERVLRQEIAGFGVR